MDTHYVNGVKHMTSAWAVGQSYGSVCFDRWCVKETNEWVGNQHHWSPYYGTNYTRTAREMAR